MLVTDKVKLFFQETVQECMKKAMTVRIIIFSIIVVFIKKLFIKICMFEKRIKTRANLGMKS